MSNPPIRSSAARSKAMDAPTPDGGSGYSGYCLRAAESHHVGHRIADGSVIHHDDLEVRVVRS